MIAPTGHAAPRGRFPRLSRALATAAVLAAAAALAPRAAAEQPLITVLPLEAIDAGAAEARAARELLQASLAGTGAWSVLAADEADRRLAAGGRAGEECTDPACAAEAGRLLGVPHVLLGSLARSGGQLIVNAKVVDAASGRVLAADSVSAARAGELEGACTRLARRLAARALGVGSAEEEPQAGEAGSETPPGSGEAAAGAAAGGEAAGGAAQAPGAEGEPGAEGQPAAPEAARERLLTWPNLTGAGAAFLGLLGNASGSVAFQLRRASDEAYEDYLSATADFDALWREYRGLHAGYGAATIASYTLWAAASAAPALHWGLYPEQAFRLTPRGRKAYGWGTALTVAGHVFDLLAGAQSYRVDFLYEDYQSAVVDRDRLRDRWLTGRVVYITERVLGYGLWGVGAAAAGGAFLLPGEREPVVEGFWEKALTVTGSALLSVGGFTSTAALNARQDYAESDGSDEGAWGRFVGWSAASCLLWAAGGTALLLPLVAEIPGGGARDPADAADASGSAGQPGGARAAGARPVQLSLLPLPGGLALQASWPGGRVQP